MFDSNAGGKDASAPFHSAQHDKTPDMRNIKNEKIRIAMIRIFLFSAIYPSG